MSHIIYSTEALVLKTAEHGEANKLFWLFTKRFGLVLTHAQSVRAAHSKLKHQLQIYGLVKVALVRGREWWRIVNVAESDLVSGDQTARRKFLAAASAFVLRLIHGEGAHEDIFAALATGGDLLSFQIKTLMALGYLAEGQTTGLDLADTQAAQALIDMGLSHSQL